MTDGTVRMNANDFETKAEGFREIAGEKIEVKFADSKFVVYGSQRAVERLFNAFKGADSKFDYSPGAQSYYFMMCTPRLEGTFQA